MSSDIRIRIIQAIDLVELVSQTVALKRQGKVYKGLCPFHQEKTPSFHVDPAKQYFHCFGCKASGTVFDFVMKRDRVEFKEALELLAQQAGIELDRRGGGASKPGERQALLDAHSAACRFFENQLYGPPGKAAREYLLTERGFTEETLKKFQVGLAVDAWDALARGPVGRKYPAATLAIGGLVKARSGGDGHYDTFRNRIMFPIRNEGGQIIAFGGRKVPGSTDPAKYLNSPETPLFSKGKAVFGLDLARQRIIETRTAAVVEGYTDVMMAHQFGASNVVSPLGTALTEGHLSILRRFADRIVLVFDGDAAGKTAMDRVIELALTQSGTSAVNIGIVTMPDGLDPDEFFLQRGPEAFDQLLANATDALEYAWIQVRTRVGGEKEDFAAEQKAIAEYLDLFARARHAQQNEVAWLAAIKRVSKLTGMPPEELHQRFKLRQPAPPRRNPEQESPVSEPARQAAPAGPRTTHTVAERQLLGVLLLEPGRWQSVQMVIGPPDFTEPQLRELAEVYWEYQRHEGEPVLSELLATLSNPALVPVAAELIEAVRDLPDADATVSGVMSYMAEARQRREEQRLVSRVIRAESADEQDQALRALMEKRKQPDLRRLGS